MRSRNVLTIAAGVLVMALLGCASARAGVAPEVRVLLYDEAGPLLVGREGAPQTLKLGERGSLQVDGRSVSDPWVPRGRGPWQVGERRVRGRVAVRARDGRIQVLNRVRLEEYVASTVGGEMSPSWPREALRAQAVATRTYVLHEAARRRRSDWDVRATAASQVYRGIAAETPETRAAARATAGQVLTHSGEPILAVFHSTAGGRTASAGEVWGRDLPYLRVVEVEEEDDAPHTYWRTTFRPDALGRVLAAAGAPVGTVQALQVTARSPSGRVERIAVKGSRASETLSGARLRKMLGGIGLKSTLFEIRETAEGFAFVGSGHGHGVGMSQWGARSMAQRGVGYRRILARFYPGTRLETLSTRRVAAWRAEPESRGDLR